MMARTPRTNSSEQKDEGQHTDGAPTGNDTSMISNPPAVNPTPRLSAEDERTEIDATLDRSLGTEADTAPASEKISVKTTGNFMLHDPTTGDTIRSEASEVRKSQFVMDQIEAGRAEEA